MVLILPLWIADTTPIKLAGYMGCPALSGAAGPSGSRVPQNEDAAALLEDIHRRCERLLTSVSERGWKDLDGQYVEPCIGLPSEWRGVMQHMAMAGQVMHDLRVAEENPLARDPPDSD